MTHNRVSAAEGGEERHTFKIIWIKKTTGIDVCTKEEYAELLRLFNVCGSTSFVTKESIIDDQNKELLSTIHLAITNGHLNIAKHLLNEGANIDFANDEGYTPIEAASTYGHLVVVEDLINRGVKIEDPNIIQRYALHHASMGGHIDVVRYLLEQGASIDIGDQRQQRPLHLASFAGKLDVVEYLLERGANVNILNKEKKHPLHYASTYGHCEVVRCLLRHGAEVDGKDREGNTPLLLAYRSRKLDTVVHLIECGARVTDVDPDEMGFVYDDTNPRAKACEAILRATQARERKLAELKLSVTAAAADEDDVTDIECAQCNGTMDCALACGHVYCTPCAQSLARCGQCHAEKGEIQKLYF